MDNYPRQFWAREIQQLLLDINEAVNNTEGNRLDSMATDEYRKRYRAILDIGDKET